MKKALPWTDADVAVMATMCAAGKRNSDIAQVLNRTEKSVRFKRHSLCFKPQGRPADGYRDMSETAIRLASSRFAEDWRRVMGAATC